jgi:amino acid transporter
MVHHYREDTDAQQLSSPPRRFDADDDPVDDRDPTYRASTDAEVNPVYRGFKLGAAFFGWLVAIGLTILLTAIIGAIAAAVDYAVTMDQSTLDTEAGTIGIVSAAVLLLVLAIAYYNGGYVAGRLARFDGARQGFGVWAIGVLVTAALAAIGALAGSQYDVLDRAELPSIPVTTETLTTGGLILAGAVLLVTLLAAVIGGKSGQRYHRRIDESR